MTPTLGEVADTLRTHAAYLVDFYGDEDRALPRHPQAHRLVPQGIPGRGRPSATPSRSSTRSAALDRLLATLDRDAPWPGEAAEGQRGRAGSSRTVVLPEGWLDSRELSDEHAAEVAAAEEHHSGG